MSIRTERLSSVIQEDLGKIIQKGYHALELWISLQGQQMPVAENTLILVLTDAQGKSQRQKLTILCRK